MPVSSKSLALAESFPRAHMASLHILHVVSWHILHVYVYVVFLPLRYMLWKSVISAYVLAHTLMLVLLWVMVIDVVVMAIVVELVIVQRCLVSMIILQVGIVVQLLMVVVRENGMDTCLAILILGPHYPHR